VVANKSFNRGFADKGYDSFNNRCLVLVKGAIPYIPFRKVEKNKPNPSDKSEL
jgi:hypothetical protein